MAPQNNVIAMPEIRSRLPMTQGATARGITPAQWRVLVEQTFPAAKSAESIELAIDYCIARNLDIFKKPVHIVPMWSSAKRDYVETLWPGINEVQITAARTGQWAGMDSPKWGPMITETFEGVKTEWKNGSKSTHKAEVLLTYPEWCEVTVHRLVGGQPRAFCEPVYWKEAYSTSGGKDSALPTDMWVKRPRGQLHKVAKAASLRAAFPEEGELTAEEMEGKIIDAGGVVIEHAPVKHEQPKIEPPVDADALEKDIDEGLAEIQTLDGLDDLWKSGINTRIKDLRATNPTSADRFFQKFNAKKKSILKSMEEEQPVDDAVDDDAQPQPTAIYDAAPPPTAIPAPETDDGWLDWTKEALEQIKTAGNLRSAGLSMHDSAWVGKWLALNAENIVKVKSINPKWAEKINELHKRVADFMKAEDEAVKAEAAEHFPTYQHSDSEQPNWQDFENTIFAYIRNTPNALIARDWWNRHKASVEFGLAKAETINSKGRTGAQAASDLKADLFKAFPQLAE